jgi:DNA-binding NtrC family response regulator
VALDPSDDCGVPHGLVLIVDDSDCVRSVVCRTLTLGGYEVLSADGVGSCRQLFAEHPVELVVVDLYLAGECGIALMREMRDARAEVPLVVISGILDGEIRALLAAAELEEKVWALAKPFTPAQLLDVVSQALAA